MKRHPALASLSRDHHHALAIALSLRRATVESAAQSAGAFLAHWNADEKLHFRIEEELLLPAYAEHGDPNRRPIIRMLLDHVLIRRDAARLTAASPLELLHDLGARLSAHVSLEEQEVFPLIETTMPEPELQALGDRIRHAHPVRRSPT
jgi:hemerythrin-like domain-containing protein